MHLASGIFLGLFAAFFVVYCTVTSRLKRPLLVLGSVAFYATYSLRYVPLLLALGVFTYCVASRIHRETAGRWRDVLLWAGIGVNVIAIVFFKIAASAQATPTTPGILHRLQMRELVLPLGISFYTLQAISFIVDVHRRVYQPPKLLSFLASFTLFPHLLSGPIVRSSFLAPRIERVDTVAWPTARKAVLLFAAGLLKKSIADRLAPTADAAFDAAGTIPMFEAWTALLAYAGQLYGDFSGYTDMATALAMLLGLDLPPNFNLPYLATSPADFWRRWHISLSSWLRDYVYLPLGVRFRRRRYFNIVSTWIIAGLWHGLTFPFLVYGLYHGVLLAMTDWLARRFDLADVQGYRRAVQTVVTFYLVLIGYVLFRARSLSAALHFVAALHSSPASSGISRHAVMAAATCVFALVFCHAMDFAIGRRATAERPWILWPATVLAVTWVLVFNESAQPFIYFGF